MTGRQVFYKCLLYRRSLTLNWTNLREFFRKVAFDCGFDAFRSLDLDNWDFHWPYFNLCNIKRGVEFTLNSVSLTFSQFWMVGYKKNSKTAFLRSLVQYCCHRSRISFPLLFKKLGNILNNSTRLDLQICQST